MKSWIQDLAIKTASKSQYPSFKHGAVLASGGRVFASGVNTEKSFAPKTGKSVHAEIVALKRAITSAVRRDRKLRFDVYVARINTLGQTGMSRPCPKCMAALQACGLIDRIYYTTNNGWEGIKV